MRGKGNKAVDLVDAFEAVSPYIQKHTSKICPSCLSVCCIDRHGCYDEDDLIFIRVLGVESDYRSDRPDTDPCRFLQKDGCSLPRHRRPFRCTWYFCDRLLESMNNDRPKEYRAFISAFENLQRLRKELLRNNAS